MVSHKAALIESRAEQRNKHCSPPAALYGQPLPCPVTIWQDLTRLFVAHCARECFFGGGRIFKRRRLVGTQTNIFSSQAVIELHFPRFCDGIWFMAVTFTHSWPQSFLFHADLIVCEDGVKKSHAIRPFQIRLGRFHVWSLIQYRFFESNQFEQTCQLYLYLIFYFNK